MSEESYTSAMMTYYESGVFFKAVADKLGLEKAMELHQDAYAIFGGGMETMLKEQPQEGVDLQALVEGMVEGLGAQGFTSEFVKKDADTMIIRNTKCPRYDGMKMAGHSDEVIKEHCLRGVRVLEKHLQNVDPEFKFDVPVWDAPNGLCDEVFKLKK